MRKKNHSLRTAWLAPVFCLLAGCGFHSVYGTHDGGTSVAEELNRVAIDPMPDRAGQMLRNDLIDRLYRKGRPSEPAYHLIVKLRLAEEDLGLLVNATSALSAVHAYGDYTLTDMKGKILAKGTTSSTASYDKLASQYSTLAAHDSAVERTTNEVSEQLLTRLNLYFAEHPPAPEAGTPATPK